MTFLTNDKFASPRLTIFIFKTIFHFNRVALFFPLRIVYIHLTYYYFTDLFNIKICVDIKFALTFISSSNHMLMQTPILLISNG